jgi:acetyl esterase/lipase
LRDPEAWAGLDRAARDAAYDNGAAFPGVGLWREALQTASAALRAARPAELDLAYGPDERNRWDLFPAERLDAPCLVFIHGGYWQRNRREDFACMAQGVAAHGWSAAILGYRLAPQAALTDIVAETHRALDWLKANGADHGIAGPMVISGWSAGAHLAVMALDHPAVSSGLAISGVYDLKPIRDTGLNDALSLTEEEVRALSPLRLPPSPKPLIIAYGASELHRLVEDSCDLHALRMAAEAPGALLEIPEADHFSILEQLERPDGALVEALVGAHGSGGAR